MIVFREENSLRNMKKSGVATYIDNFKLSLNDLALYIVENKIIQIRNLRRL